MVRRQNTSIDFGIKVLDRLMTSVHHDAQRKLALWILSDKPEVPPVNFEDTPIHAMWYRRDVLAWCMIANIQHVATVETIPWQTRYDSMLAANSANGRNGMLKRAYDALYDEDAYGGLTAFPTEGFALEALAYALEHYREDGNNVIKMMSTLSIPLRRKVEQALLKGALIRMAGPLPI